MKKELIKILKNPSLKKGRGGILTTKDIDYEHWCLEIISLIAVKLESGYLKTN